MECLFGLVGKDFAITVSDATSIQSIVVMKHTEDKSRNLNKHIIMLYAGEPGDTVNFAEYIQRNVRFYEIKNGIELSPQAAAKFTRRQVAESLRSRQPYSVNLLIAGYDVKTEASQLYWIDYLGSLIEIPFAAHGYGAYYVTSVLDRYYYPQISLDEAKVLIKKCIDELKTRFFINLSNFKIKVSNKDGIQEIVL
ncbi:8075_t:CDS:2 [Ambispora gerdemannii]|uniref:Proteasome subunit beta n=1 Tax=Ambispora gerdemannii TaxID=144530 RepID=A0A9N8WJP7_9GLOM|nr:8075_t:CDS:2 [Ambispora gerdemannii]